MRKENTSEEYVGVRVKLVRVKKGLLGYKDEVYGAITVIPDTPKNAEHLYKKIKSMCLEYGVEFKVEK